MHFTLMKNNMAALNKEHPTKIWNPRNMKLWTNNCKLPFGVPMKNLMVKVLIITKPEIPMNK